MTWCFICDEKLGGNGKPKSKVIQDNNRNALQCQRFCKLVCRYLDIKIKNDFSDLDLDQRDGDGADLYHNATRKRKMLSLEVPKRRLCCDNCLPEVKAFCRIYQQWDLLRLQLNQRSKVISELMMDNDKNDHVRHDYEQLTVAIPGGEEGNRRFKEAFISKVKKNPMDYPHLRLNKLKTGSDDLDLAPAPAKKSKVSFPKQKPIMLKILFDSTELDQDLGQTQTLPEEEIDDVVQVNTEMIDNPERILKRFKCQFCDVKFTRRDKRQEHERRAHTRERNFACDLCPAPGKHFSMQYQLFEHLDKFHKEGQGSASQNKVSANLIEAKKQEVRSQMKMKISQFKDRVKVYHCRACDLAFPNEEAKTEHETSHVNELPFECPICHKRFGRNDHRKRHVLNLHQKGTQPQEVSKSLQKKHEGQRSKVNAETEGGTDDPGDSLALAVIKKKIDDDDANDDGDGADSVSLPLALFDDQMKGPRHKCQMCGDVFPDEESFTLHRELNHSSKLRFSCDICGKKFTRSQHVKRHVAGVHQQQQKLKRKRTSFVYYVGHRMAEDDDDDRDGDPENGNDVSANEVGENNVIE